MFYIEVSSNIRTPIYVIELEIITFYNDVHEEKTSSADYITEFGISIDVKLVQL